MTWRIVLAVLLTTRAGAAEAPLSVPADSPRWELEGKARASEVKGQKCLALDGGAAMLKDFELTDGVVDVDAVTAGQRGFFGIQFRVANEGAEAEYVYLRPHKSGLPDALQYTPILHTGLNWQIYSGPGFTAALDIPRDAWFHIRLEVAGAQARLFVGDMAKPALEMTDLKSGVAKGGLALVSLTGDTCFGNFTVRATPPVVWQRRAPAMPAGTLTRWQISPAVDALARDLEKPLSRAERDAMKWDDVEAEAPGFVVLNRVRESPHPKVSFAGDWSKRLEPQPGMKMVYARTTIVADKAGVKKLELGYSDDVSVFLNDQILYRGRSAQNFRDPGFLGIMSADNDALYLPLKKGRNELVLAVSELGGGWGFVCRLLDAR